MQLPRTPGLLVQLPLKWPGLLVQLPLTPGLLVQLPLVWPGLLVQLPLTPGLLMQLHQRLGLLMQLPMGR